MIVYLQLGFEIKNNYGLGNKMVFYNYEKLIN